MTKEIYYVPLDPFWWVFVAPDFAPETKKKKNQNTPKYKAPSHFQWREPWILPQSLMLYILNVLTALSWAALWRARLLWNTTPSTRVDTDTMAMAGRPTRLMNCSA